MKGHLNVSQKRVNLCGDMAYISAQIQRVSKFQNLFQTFVDLVVAAISGVPVLQEIATAIRAS